MRTKDFNIQELISNLNGTCDSLSSALPEGMEEDDLTMEELEALDQEIFHCASCGWWYEVSQESGVDPSELICDDCSGDWE